MGRRDNQSLLVKLCRFGLLTLCLPLVSGACNSDVDEGPTKPALVCSLLVEELSDNIPEYSQTIGCPADFETLARLPANLAVPGAMSSKTLIDRMDDDQLYFLNASKYPIHHTFARDFLSGKGKPIVGTLQSFNQTEYYSPDRRFLLGAVTRYEGPGVWAYEIVAYDTASAAMITQAFDAIAAASYFGDELVFHPTSEGLEEVAKKLPAHIKVVDNDALYAGMEFVPLNPGTAVGQLRVYSVADLNSGEAFVTPRDIAVIDEVPNDIAVVAGLITGQMQTPLSHVNVLSQNRGTPNMALLDAHKKASITNLDGKWVKLEVTPFDYTLVEVDKATADAWWEKHKPAAIKVPDLALEVTELTNTEDIGLDQIPSFGGKAANYGELARIAAVQPTPHVFTVPKAFAVPMAWYKEFEKSHGFDQRVIKLLADPEFLSAPKVRDAELKKLRDDIRAAPLDPVFIKLLADKLSADYAGVRMRFRSSTNAEDLDGFTGAGLYDSKTYDPDDPKKPMADAVRKVWSSLWNLRAFEERSWRGIDHLGVAMALLCHRGFPAEDSNGVALTNNIFNVNEQGAFYINVQKGDVPVVRPPGGELPDELLYYFSYPNQPVSWMGHSSLVPKGSTVLTNSELYELGQGLDLVHKGFAKHYSKGGAFYAMDVEFKFNTDPGETKSKVWIKQARPHPGWGGATSGN